MARIKIGRTVRRLGLERDLSQQALATRLGISASYLNLIEHDQRAVSGSLLIKIAETLQLDLTALSGAEERKLEVGLREVFSDPLLGADAVPEAEIGALVGSGPNAARAVLALYRAWRVAREDAGGIALPSGRRLLLPNEEAREFFDDRANHFPVLEETADSIAAELGAAPAEMNRAIAERLRRVHGLTVTVQPLDGVLRRFDSTARHLALAETLPRESRGFQMAFQLALIEAREAVETVLAGAAPSSAEAAMLIRIGLFNYIAGALLMPYAAFLAAAGAAYLCFARTVMRPALRWGEPRPVHVVAMGCSLSHAGELVYADGLDLERAKVGIACRAGCATAPIAAAAPSHRSSTASRSTR
jgi:transcriptional regulator with XRE-family HTH domain